MILRESGKKFHIVPGERRFLCTIFECKTLNSEIKEKGKREKKEIKIYFQELAIIITLY